METEILKNVKTVRINDGNYKKVRAISIAQDWRDAHTLNRLIECGLEHWEAKK